MSYTAFCTACGNTGCAQCAGARIEVIQRAAVQDRTDRVGELVEQFCREYGVRYDDPTAERHARSMIGRAIAYGIQHATEGDTTTERKAERSRWDMLELE